MDSAVSSQFLRACLALYFHLFVSLRAGEKSQATTKEMNPSRNVRQRAVFGIFYLHKRAVQS